VRVVDMGEEILVKLILIQKVLLGEQGALVVGAQEFAEDLFLLSPRDASAL
jgi:hypothetical protein